ncbi:MAG: hypothetical protein LBD78_00415 [Spirochaetaceae bacterium]|jgi:hypothetical protein|nr:hypothetical protein [Spirochaetaceae bacterium]
MFSLKWSGAAGVFAFALSFLIGLFGGGAFIALIRALIFGALFFILASLAYLLISRFLPELLEPDDSGEDEAAGSRVDITVEDDDESGIFGRASPERNSLSEGGGKAAGATAEAGMGPENRMALDQNGEDGYTKEGNVAPSGQGEDASVDGSRERGDSGLVAVPAVPGDSADSVDELPDLGSLSSAFLPSGGESETKAPMLPSSIPDIPEGAGKKQGAGDFNLKEMASAIQTILKRD